MNRTIQMILVMMASLATASATDIFLPSLPSMAIYFGASDKSTQIAIPLYLLGSFVAAPAFGILSDNLGKRPVMLSGFVFFLLGTFICIYASSLPFFLTARFIQGLGAAVIPVVGWAYIQDLYPADEGAKIMSWLMAVISVGPFVAPGLGGFIHVAFGWQGNFIFIFMFAVLTFILMLVFNPKQKRLKNKEKVLFSSSLKIYARILKDLPFLCYLSFMAFLASSEMCYLTIAPFYFENTLHLSPAVFGLYLSGSVSVFIIGGICTPFLLKRLRIINTIKLGIQLTLIAGVALVGVSFFASSNILLITLAVGLYFFGASFVWGPSNSRTLGRFEDIRGSASAVRSLFITASFAIGGFVGSFLDDSSIVPLSFFLLAMAITCWIVLQKVVKLEA